MLFACKSSVILARSCRAACFGSSSHVFSRQEESRFSSTFLIFFDRTSYLEIVQWGSKIPRIWLETGRSGIAWYFVRSLRFSKKANESVENTRNKTKTILMLTLVRSSLNNNKISTFLWSLLAVKGSTEATYWKRPRWKEVEHALTLIFYRYHRAGSYK